MLSAANLSTTNPSSGVSSHYKVCTASLAHSANVVHWLLDEVCPKLELGIELKYETPKRTIAIDLEW